MPATAAAASATAASSTAAASTTTAVAAYRIIGAAFTDKECLWLCIVKVISSAAQNFSSPRFFDSGEETYKPIVQQQCKDDGKQTVADILHRLSDLLSL